MLKLLYKSKRILLPAVLLVIVGRAAAQIKISGPKCIIPGITYQYDINSPDDSTNISVTIKGGAVTNGVRASTDNVKVSAVFVVWKDTAYHQVEALSKRGNANLLVHQTSALDGGKLQEGDMLQRYDSTAADHTFHCSLPTGGSCTPNYTYQWQRSEDGFRWTDIPNAKEKDLLISVKPESDLYYRRVTMEAQSNTISYSDVGTLMVIRF